MSKLFQLATWLLMRYISIRSKEAFWRTLQTKPLMRRQPAPARLCHSSMHSLQISALRIIQSMSTKFKNRCWAPLRQLHFEDFTCNRRTDPTHQHHHWTSHLPPRLQTFLQRIHEMPIPHLHLPLWRVSPRSHRSWRETIHHWRRDRISADDRQKYCGWSQKWIPHSLERSKQQN